MIQRLLPFLTLIVLFVAPGDRLAALPDEHESLERGPADGRDQHHGARA